MNFINFRSVTNRKVNAYKSATFHRQDSCKTCPLKQIIKNCTKTHNNEKNNLCNYNNTCL